MVERVVKDRLGKFTKSDIQEHCPTLARQTIEKALKAKIKNPAKVKIHLYPPEANHGKYHFYWEKEGKYYHYIKRNPRAFLFFNGRVRECPFNPFFASLMHKMYLAGYDREGFARLIKKYRLPLNKEDIEAAFYNEEADEDEDL